MENTEYPQISVIIPAKNEAKLLPKCLASLTQQNTKVSYETILVDTNSEDGTPEIARSFGARVIHEPRQGKVYAFRSGAEAARGNILCFAEADCILPETWIETILDYLERHPDVVAVSGTYTFHSTTRFYNFIALVMQPLSLWMYNLLFSSISLRGSNFAIRASAYQAVGGFPENYFELYDVELGRRVAHLGPIHHVPDMKIQTSDRRIRGRLLRFLLEFIPSFVRNILLQRPLRSQTYEDIR
jgi:Glycosyltransferases, probably involved in cell wall biogenesis